MPSRRFILQALLAGAVAWGGGCDRPSPDGTRIIRVWSHQGQEAENLALRAIASAFNRAHADRGLRVELTFFPDFQYTEKVAIAAAAHDLPDAFDLDGPLVARFVDAGLLAPLESWFSAEELEDFLPTIRAQGTIAQRLYALGAFDSAAVLYYDRHMLARAAVTPPGDGSAWTWEEFLAAAEKLRATGVEPVAMHFNESADEWYTYAFSPVIWSGGGALISDDGMQVRGVLASEANVRSLTAWQKLFRRGLAATDPVDPDPFGHGAVAMDWSGHWMARSHREKKGDALGAMPLPRVGPQAVAPCGSWCWGVAARSQQPELAALWVRWVTDAREGIVPIVRANGAVPARRSAFASFPEYGHPPYALFRAQLEQNARPRPRTPYYATLTQQFAAALRDIARGADVATRLRAAEEEVQRVIDRRQGRDLGRNDRRSAATVAAEVTRQDRTVNAGPLPRYLGSYAESAALPVSPNACKINSRGEEHHPPRWRVVPPPQGGNYFAREALTLDPSFEEGGPCASTVGGVPLYLTGIAVSPVGPDLASVPRRLPP